MNPLPLLLIAGLLAWFFPVDVLAADSTAYDDNAASTDDHAAAAAAAESEVVAVSPFLQLETGPFLNLATTTPGPRHPRDYWEKRLELLKLGMTLTEVCALFPPCSGAYTGGGLRGISSGITYRIDAAWSISVSFSGDLWTRSEQPNSVARLKLPAAITKFQKITVVVRPLRREPSMHHKH